MDRILFCVIFTAMIASYVSNADAKEVSHSISYMTVKCDTNDAFACHMLAGHYAAGREVEKDYEKALALSIKACNLKQYEACHNAGLFYSKGYGTPINIKNAAFYYEKSCRGGMTAACSRGAALYMLGENPTAEDIKDAEIQSNASCDKGDAEGCKQKKLFADIRAGKEPSRSLYESEFEYQCYERDYNSCRVQGDRYLSGIGPIKNHKKAKDFYDRACIGGNDGKTCHQLGLLFIPGENNTGNLETSLSYLDLGCDANYEDSCILLINIYQIGKLGAPQDTDKVMYYKKKLCEISSEGKGC